MRIFALGFLPNCISPRLYPRLGRVSLKLPSVTHEGRYGAGSFVWFPKGETMEHGASAEKDVIVLFITNKPFEIHYTLLRDLARLHRAVGCSDAHPSSILKMARQEAPRVVEEIL